MVSALHCISKTSKILSPRGSLDPVISDMRLWACFSMSDGCAGAVV